MMLMTNQKVVDDDDDNNANSKVLEKCQHVLKILDEEYLYVFICKRCRTKYTEFEKYINHVIESKHRGCILQVISDDEMITLK